MELTIRKYRPGFGIKVQVVTAVESDGDLRALQVLGGGG
jgi:hypothetical protein